MLISGELEYWDESVQDEIENLTRTFEQSQYISSNTFYTESWLRSFLGYIDRNQDSMNISIDTQEGFIDTLKEVSVENSILPVWLYEHDFNYKFSSVWKFTLFSNPQKSENRTVTKMLGTVPNIIS